jgi:hypothetical protein
LFTLVGIAGEDDLDAPDLPLSGGPPAASNPDQANGHALDLGRRANGDGRRQRAPSRATLEPEASAALRDQLLAGLADLARTEDLDRWAHRCLPAKNTLATDDARRVEEAFQLKLNDVGAADAAPNEAAPSPSQAALPHGIQPATAETAPEAIDKSALAFPEPRRQRNKIHLRFVARQPCLICGRQPCDAHHLRFAQSRGLGLKVSDEFTVPLCRGHHRELHRAGNEANWWTARGIDAIGAARKLWTETHPVRVLASAIGTNAAASDKTKPIQIPRPQL